MSGDNRPCLRASLRLLNADLRRRLELEGRPDTLLRKLSLLLQRGGFAVTVFRLQDYAYARGWRLVVKLSYLLLYYFGRAEIHAGAQVGPGLVLPNGGGAGFPKFCSIGSRCTFMGPALLTIGGMEGVDLTRDRITMGDDCIVGANVRILGAVELGHGCQIKPGSVVMTSFSKEGLLLSGVPARRRGQFVLENIRAWSPLRGRPVSQKEKMIMQCQSLKQTFALLQQDIAFRCEYEHKPKSWLNTLKMLTNPGVLCVVLYRFQVFFASHWLAPLAGFLEYVNLILFAVAIDSAARISGGLVVIHANAIFISARVVIGRNCLLFHQNSIGFSPFFAEEGQGANGPCLGDHVIVGAGASICGPISVGSGSKIAVNAALDIDCPEHSVMFGVPARQVSKT